MTVQGFAGSTSLLSPVHKGRALDRGQHCHVTSLNVAATYQLFRTGRQLVQLCIQALALVEQWLCSSLSLFLLISFQPACSHKRSAYHITVLLSVQQR